MGESVTLSLCGDVMTGRGIDQALPHPCSPELYESYVLDARGYVDLAEAHSGAIPRPLGFGDIWGDALDELAQVNPAIRLINLETSITTNPEPWAGKGINYRMSPDNAPCLKAADITACALANNHVLDWGVEGLRESVQVLDRLGIAHAGAGEDDTAASEPVRLTIAQGARVLMWSIGVADSGIPAAWQAATGRPGVWQIAKASAASAAPLARRIRAEKRPGDLVVVSVHWGGNWGYGIPAGHRAFARHLVDAGADLIHGHSSHHPKGIEIYRGRPILYGCGDFINDYEGIGGYDTFRPELTLMYFCRFAVGSAELLDLWMTPFRIERFSLHRANESEAQWLLAMLNRERYPDTPKFSLNTAGRLRWR